MTAARAEAGLAQYRRKRDFARTPEPAGAATAPGPDLSFVVQRHAARRLHYDFRLEWAGVLKSWAVTRGPSLDPADKRLAVETEDHPLEYGEFEGVIPKGAYGGGTVQLWDRGLWAPVNPAGVEQDLDKGELKFVLSGRRLRGGFVLVRLKPRAGDTPGRHNWLLIKERDSMATPGQGDTILAESTSVKSGLTLGQIAAGAAEAPPTIAAAIPGFVPPQLCRLVTTPPAGPQWLHELKLDGYRLQLRVAEGRATLRTRTGLDWSKRFKPIVAAAAGLPDGLADGEVVALDPDGQPSFALLQAALAGESRAPLVLYLFDLLHDGQQDLQPEPLERRKAALARWLGGIDAAGIRFLQDFPAPGEAVLASACRLHMEGIVSKRRADPYRSGRGDSWTKSKCRGRDEFVVGGWTAEKSGRGLGALLVGAIRDEKFIYLGRVGTGFTGVVATGLLKRLSGLKRARSPFEGRQPQRLSDVTWVKPGLVVEVAYGGVTGDGLLRHASFQGLREDKPAASVAAPAPPAAQPEPPAAQPRPAPALRLTHPERVLWPATDTTPAITKADLAAHYTRFADRILASAGGRPLSVLRAPDGLGGPQFFQRHAMPGQSPLIGAVAMPGQKKPFMRVDDLPGLLALAQMSVMELHPAGARADTPEVPDRLVFDLDPDEGLDFAHVIRAAQALRRRLEAIGLSAFARVSGGKGMHLVVPLAPPRPGDSAGWPEAKQFARLVCVTLERDAPDRFTTTMAKRARTGRIFLDYLRNDLLSTAIASWSPRARPGAPVARPVAWSEVKDGLLPGGWKLPALAEAAPPRDPWRGFATAGIPLAEAIHALTARLGKPG